MRVELAIPCFNEEITISKVVQDFRAELPDAEIVVYDNNSQDRSAELSEAAGAKVIKVKRQGKGYVVQEVFRKSNADIVILVDADDTYEAKDVHGLLHPIQIEIADMVIGTRLHSDKNDFRQLHHFGNRMLTRALNLMFRTRYLDILSGFRALNRNFIQNVPIVSIGFEVETEMMIQALELDMTIKEVPIQFRQRPHGSHSKLETFRDGYRILGLMVSMLRDHRPLYSFSIAGVLSILTGAFLWMIGFLYGKENPFIMLSRSVGALLIIFSVGLFLVGLILNTINTRMRELYSIIRRKL